MLKGCSREEVTVPAPVGASRSLRDEVGMPRIIFVPTASNTSCERGMPYKHCTLQIDEGRLLSDGALVIAVYGSMYASDTSWLVFAAVKAWYNRVYHR